APRSGALHEKIGPAARSKRRLHAGESRVRTSTWLGRASVQYPLTAVSPSPDLVWQPSLLASDEDVGLDPAFAALQHIDLDDRSWVDHAPGWVRGPDRVFELLLESRDWGQRSRRMYDQRVREPRLTAPWNVRSG